MNTAIFQEWYKFCEWIGDRQVLLLVDNCPAHIKLEARPNVRVLFLPKNTTALSQTLDQGVIKEMKDHYRGFLIQYGLKPDLAKVMEMATKAWEDIPRQNMINYFGQLLYTQ